MDNNSSSKPSAMDEKSAFCFFDNSIKFPSSPAAAAVAQAHICLYYLFLVSAAFRPLLNTRGPWNIPILRLATWKIGNANKCSFHNTKPFWSHPIQCIEIRLARRQISSHNVHLNVYLSHESPCCCDISPVWPRAATAASCAPTNSILCFPLRRDPAVCM